LRERERKLRLEAISWTLPMSIAAFGAVVALLPFLQRPALDAYLPLFGLILLATWVRIGADQYGYLLLALHRDRAILIACAVGAMASATFNAILLPNFGLWGAATAFLLTGLAVVTLEWSMSRHPLPGQVAVHT
jgi:O-antigen/teichoic acid export membrane protein